jgi:ferredoxin
MPFPTIRLCHHLFKARTIVKRESQRISLASPCRTFHGTSSRFGKTTEELGDCLDQKYGIDRKLHSGIFKALQSVHGPKLVIEHLEAFGKSGLEALAVSVQVQLSKRQGRPKRPSTMLKVSVPHHGTSFELKWKLGDTVVEAAQENEELMAEYMEGTCGGIMSCCTCHIYIDQPEFQAFLSEPEESELDMLVSWNESPLLCSI